MIPADNRRAVFEFLFGQEEGYFCIATRNARNGQFAEKYFEYPKQLDEAIDHAYRLKVTCDVWFCPQLFNQRQRKKDYAQLVTAAWGDLDDCHFDNMLVEPTIVFETSKDRYQALWQFKQPIHPNDAEDISRRIAYFHEAEGMDKSGWDLTQLLRFPFTFNHKYASQVGLQEVAVVVAKPERKYDPSDFKDYPEVKEFLKLDIPFPEELSDKTGLEILEEHKMNINPQVWPLFEQAPFKDWSKALWRLEMILLEYGLSMEEAFIVARDAACNKYKRDGRSQEYLWKDITRAFSAHQEQAVHEDPVDDRDEETKPEPDLSLLTPEEREAVMKDKGFIEDYTDWARGLGDAAWQYHQAGAFIILSSIISGKVDLPTSYGTLYPNLWFMILADTTLTRKTTAMDLAMDFLAEVDDQAMLATDGSIEGLLTAISMRPKRPSIFLRDEFSGLLEMMTKRDYYAGMLETLTKLYDGRSQKRVLRKETIDVRDPILLLFAGGIKERILSLLDYDHVASGFLPRMIFVSAESDVKRLKPLGPPTEATLDKRDELIARLRDMDAHYRTDDAKAVGNTVALPKSWHAKLTDDAWVRYNKFEAQLLQQGLDSTNKDLATPSFDRLAKSGLKAAVLIAASRRLASEVIVEEKDIVKAFYYVEQWRPFVVEVLANLGKSTQERTIEKVQGAITKAPGIRRSQIMQRYRLTSRDVELVFGTLEQRGQIKRIRSGRGERLYPIGK